MNLTLKMFFELKEPAQAGILDNIQKNVLNYMRSKKTKTYAERETAKDLKVSMELVHHSTSIKSFKEKYLALRHKGEL